MTRLEFLALAAWQMRRRVEPRQAPEPVYPLFHGVIRGLSGSKLSLEVEGGNVMDFRLLRQTRYVQGEKTIARDKLKVGDEVDVEGRHAPDASLDAMSVRLPAK